MHNLLLARAVRTFGLTSFKHFINFSLSFLLRALRVHFLLFLTATSLYSQVSTCRETCMVGLKVLLFFSLDVVSLSTGLFYLPRGLFPVGWGFCLHAMRTR